jgi:hypothetical protein
MNNGRYAVMVHGPKIGVELLDTFNDERRAAEEREKIVGQPVLEAVVVDGHVVGWKEIETITGAFIVDREKRDVL